MAFSALLGSRTILKKMPKGYIFEAPELWYQVVTSFSSLYNFYNEMRKQNAEFNENLLLG